MADSKDVSGKSYSDWLKQNYDLDISITVDPNQLEGGKPKASNPQ